ncbi:hypothetical protein [Rhizobium leguminosarum]|uniref:hypothetical protein n=1 Tax=Rhizobium leguminosarum TaxID=384 RepID=UPI00143F972E|nr:hypothetical protein [Rhizobium leguminosarum]NKL23661.1 hypothetical protein [Rhizobium leguminosarum bv. viciae]
MKMPWSFLKRRRVEDPAPTEVDEAKETSDTEEKAASLVDRPSVAPASLWYLVPEMEGEAASETTVPAVSVDDAQPTHSPGSRRRPSATHTQRGKAVASSRGGRPNASKAEKQVAPPSDPESGAIDGSVQSAFVLDDEIKNLRRQLAEKLRLQNIQLKKMLDRYS